MILIALWLNKDLKQTIYTDVIGKQDGALAFRSLQSAWSNIIKTASARYIPLTIISMFASLGPPIAVALAFCLLNERLSFSENIILFV